MADLTKGHHPHRDPYAPHPANQFPELRRKKEGTSGRKRKLVPKHCSGGRQHAMNAARKLSRGTATLPPLEVVVGYGGEDHGWWIFPEPHAPRNPMSERGKFYAGVYSHPNPERYRAVLLESELYELRSQLADLWEDRKMGDDLNAQAIDQTKRKIRVKKAEQIAEIKPTPVWDVTIRQAGVNVSTTIRNFSSIAAEAEALEKIPGGKIVDTVLIDADWTDESHVTGRHTNSTGDTEHTDGTAELVDPHPSILERIEALEDYGVDYFTLSEYMTEDTSPAAPPLAAMLK